MTTRRQIVKAMLMLIAFFSASKSRLGRTVSIVRPKTERRIVKNVTPMASLMHADPADLDTKRLETTTIHEFDVIGETAHPVDLQNWRLSTRGAVKSPKDFTYNELLARPVFEINVL